MARKKLREYDAKKLLEKFVEDYKFIGTFATKETNLEELEKNNPWLKENNLVVKPDQLIGKKGKNNIILLNKNWEDSKKYIKENLGKEIEIKGVKGNIERFIIEPFIEHENEYYFAILTNREYDEILFSPTGGVDIEENWDSVKSLKVPIGELAKLEEIEKLTNDKKIANFIFNIHEFFINQDLSYIEMNPLAYNKDEKLMPLGLVLELDRSADYKHRDDWKDIEFVEGFGKSYTKEEKYIRDLDAKTGASLKLTILNPKGKVWTLVAGGGASVVYSDAVADLGMGKELANYGEYSGNPSRIDTYHYAKTVFDLLTRDGQKGKVLLIGGGVANFTNVAATFKGIIQAMEEFAPKFRDMDLKIYVRRGGPNYEEGLRLMREVGKKINVPIDVYGPETNMTKIVSLAKGVLGGN